MELLNIFWVSDDNIAMVVGAAVFAFEYVTTFATSVVVPLPSLYRTNNDNDPESALKSLIA